MDCELPSYFWPPRVPSAYCRLRTAYCIWGEFELEGRLARTAAYDKMSPWLGKKRLQ